MHNTLILVGAAVVAYICRISGFVLPIRNTSPTWEQFLQFVPIAVFATLTVSSLGTDSATLSPKLLALGLSGIMMWRTRHFGLAILFGLSVYWFCVMSNIA
jgi:branched-subunit amino acid transport protein